MTFPILPLSGATQSLQTVPRRSTTFSWKTCTAPSGTMHTRTFPLRRIVAPQLQHHRRRELRQVAPGVTVHRRPVGVRAAAAAAAPLEHGLRQQPGDVALLKQASQRAACTVAVAKGGSDGRETSLRRGAGTRYSRHDLHLQ